MLTQLLALIDAFCAARGISEARASTLIFNGGARVAQLRSGADIGIRRAEKAKRWISENWPDDVDWPADIERPLAADHDEEAAA